MPEGKKEPYLVIENDSQEDVRFLIRIRIEPSNCYGFVTFWG
jgi:hypothetical protein